MAWVSSRRALGKVSGRVKPAADGQFNPPGVLLVVGNPPSATLDCQPWQQIAGTLGLDVQGQPDPALRCTVPYISDGSEAQHCDRSDGRLPGGAGVSGRSARADVQAQSHASSNTVRHHRNTAVCSNTSDGQRHLPLPLPLEATAAPASSLPARPPARPPACKQRMTCIEHTSDSQNLLYNAIMQ